MNERILDLADKAYAEAGASELGIVNIPDQFCLKFAELIVRECAELMPQDNLYKMVLKHFGVKE